MTPSTSSSSNPAASAGVSGIRKPMPACHGAGEVDRPRDRVVEREAIAGDVGFRLFTGPGTEGQHERLDHAPAHRAGHLGAAAKAERDPAIRQHVRHGGPCPGAALERRRPGTRARRGAASRRDSWARCVDTTHAARAGRMLASIRRHSVASGAGIVPHRAPVGLTEIALLGGELRLVAVGRDLVGIHANQELGAPEARLDAHGEQHERPRRVEPREVGFGALRRAPAMASPSWPRSRCSAARSPATARRPRSSRAWLPPLSDGSPSRRACSSAAAAPCRQELELRPPGAGACELSAKLVGIGHGHLNAATCRRRGCRCAPGAAA